MLHYIGFLLLLDIIHKLPSRQLKIIRKYMLKVFYENTSNLFLRVKCEHIDKLVRDG